jgi:magnesium transporter
MFRALQFNQKGNLINNNLQPIDIAFALQDPDSILWVDFMGTAPEDDEPLLHKAFHFHPLAIDDALRESHIPKVDDWGEYLYIVLHAVRLDKSDQLELATQELDVFLGERFLVTHHDVSIAPMERIWEAVQRDNRHVKNGPDYLLYRLIDELVECYSPVVDELDRQIDEVEGELFNHPEPDTLEKIFSLKRVVLDLRRILGPQREVLNKMARNEYQTIDSQARVYFRDVYDHLVRLYDISENIRDLIGSTIETYLSVTNNRMNEVMKTLTVITTLFMPISFVASFFGMNFFEPSFPFPEWTDQPVFYLTLAAMLVGPFGMLYWMRRRHWM